MSRLPSPFPASFPLAPPRVHRLASSERHKATSPSPLFSPPLHVAMRLLADNGRRHPHSPSTSDDPFEGPVSTGRRRGSSGGRCTGCAPGVPPDSPRSSSPSPEHSTRDTARGRTLQLRSKEEALDHGDIATLLCPHGRTCSRHCASHASRVEKEWLHETQPQGTQKRHQYSVGRSTVRNVIVDRGWIISSLQDSRHGDSEREL